MEKTLIECKNLSKSFKDLVAVDAISFSIYPGQIFGLAGESGSGKSTIGKLLLGLLSPSDGTILYQGKEIFSFSPKEKKEFKKEAQMIFQDSSASLNPRMTIEEILLEPFLIHKMPISSTTAQELLSLVGLPSYFSKKHPHECSGGQKQRIVIARAISLKPKFIVCDEPVSSLDLSIQTQIISLLKDLQKEYALSYLFISHDLSLLSHLCDQVGILYFGHMMEMGSAKEIFAKPLHPYTKELLQSVLSADPEKEKAKKRELLKSETHSREKKIEGCPFKERCSLFEKDCAKKIPSFEKERFVKCIKRET